MPGIAVLLGTPSRHGIASGMRFFMARLEDLTRGASVKGILPDGLVTIVDVKWIGTVAIELTLTATPHNGKEEDFQLFLALLDGDRFEGKFRDGVHDVGTTDFMRRLVKEQLLKFDGTPLFPERRAYTVWIRPPPPAPSPNRGSRSTCSSGWRT